MTRPKRPPPTRHQGEQGHDLVILSQGGHSCSTCDGCLQQFDQPRGFFKGIVLIFLSVPYEVLDQIWCITVHGGRNARSLEKQAAVLY